MKINILDLLIMVLAILVMSLSLTSCGNAQNAYELKKVRNLNTNEIGTLHLHIDQEIGDTIKRENSWPNCADEQYTKYLILN